MKLKNKITIINLLEIGSMLFAIGVILIIFIKRAQQPAGVCPVDNYRTLLYFSLTLLIGVNLGTFLYTYWKKKRTD